MDLRARRRALQGKGAVHASRLERYRLPLLWLIVAVMLMAGLWPTARPRPNEATLDPARGLVLHGRGQLVAGTPVDVRSGAFTLEAWLRPAWARPPGANQEILSLLDRNPVPPLLLGEWPGGFLLRMRSDNPRGRPEDDRYTDWPHAPERILIAVIGDATGTRIYQAGRLVAPKVPTPAPAAGTAFGGRLVLGSSERGWPLWAGTIEAVALHDRALKESTVRAHAALSAAELAPSLAAIRPRPSLLCVFLGRPASVGPIGGPGCADLKLPKRMTRPSPPVLSLHLGADRHSTWLVRDLVVNVLGFVPLGGLLAWRRGKRGVVYALLAAAALSLAIELLQPWIPGRSSSAVDLLTNVLGAALGAGAAQLLLARKTTSEPLRRMSLKR